MKKIMFKDLFGLTKAVLELYKTMTRRVAYNKPMQYEPHVGIEDGYLILLDGWQIVAKSAYRIGEEVAIAQCYKDIDYRGIVAFEDASDIQPGMVSPIYAQESAGWTNKMFVRADLMEETIHIINIKAERLQDISDEDCMKEGVEKWIDCYIVCGIMENQGKNNVCFDTPREAFAALIDRISGKGTWGSNPWVVAYQFHLQRAKGFPK